MALYNDIFAKVCDRKKEENTEEERRKFFKRWVEENKKNGLK